MGENYMKILIYDDNEIDITNLKDCIFNFFNQKHLQYTVDICPNKEFLLSKINNYDLLFLDINLENEHGIEIGLELRKRNVECKIIITSNYPEYVYDGYKIKAIRYFLKPVNQTEFCIEMETVLKQYITNIQGIKDKKISIKKIYFKEILYVDYYNRKTRLHLMNGTILDTPYSLKYWSHTFQNQSFGQPHRAYIINFNYISEYKNQSIKLINDEEIPISRHYKAAFEQTYLDNLQNMI